MKPGYKEEGEEEKIGRKGKRERERKGEWIEREKRE